MDSIIPHPPFPDAGILPKMDTCVSSFLSCDPSRDGRGVLMAIFDTGCDAWAPGLHWTSDGAEKMVDFIDCSGSGDVSMIRVAWSDGLLVSPHTGRDLTLPAQWRQRCNTGRATIGVKRAYELFPDMLVNRLKKERAKTWSEEIKKLESSLSASLNSCSESDKLDVESRLADVRSYANAEDLGPVYDVFAFDDGERWWAAVDSTATGDFTHAALLTSYARYPADYKGNKHAVFTGADRMNYTVNIYADGAIVSIVTTAGSHGTHVAGIAGAHFTSSEQVCSDPSSAFDGIAPGVRFLSIKIGDSRLGSMETNVGLCRGIVEAIKYKVDVINMSYGEAASIPNTGRFSELVNEAITQHNIVFVSSAGNNGPALSTVGSVGGTDTNIIGVGAYCSPSMAAACYSARKPIHPDGVQYTWSSQGPALDGFIGPSISACGGAITTVCEWQLQRNQLMNGTSMSSPHAAGGIALLISALKAAGIPYTPMRIKHAIEVTARQLPHISPLSLGRGLLDVSAAYEFLSTKSTSYHDLTYKLTVGAGGRGIYIRDAKECDKPYETNVMIEPIFKEHPPPLDVANNQNTIALQDHYAWNQQKLDFQLKLALTCTSSFVTHPSHLLLMHGGRSISVGVDVQKLEPGHYFTEILAYDTQATNNNTPIFRIPITVVKPLPLSASHDYHFNTQFQNGTIVRKFVVIPDGATHVDFKITGINLEEQRSFMFHSLYLLPEVAFRDNECNHFFTLSPSENEKSYSLDVLSGNGSVLEICLAQYWSSVGDSTVDIDVEFHGVSVESAAIAFDAASTIKRVELRAQLRNEKITPCIQLKTMVQNIRPHMSNITILTPERDLFPGSRQSQQMIITYNFEQKDDSSKVQIRFPFLQDRLYESPYEAQLYTIFLDKRPIFTGDAFTSGKSLKSGSYTVRLCVRHDEVGMLEKLRDITMQVESNVKTFEIAAYASYTQLATNSAKFGSKLMKQGSRRALFLHALDHKSLSSLGLKYGDYLQGYMTLFDKDEKKGAVAVKYYPAPSPNPGAATNSKESGSVEVKDKDKDKEKENKDDKVNEPEADPSFPKDEEKNNDNNNSSAVEPSTSASDKPSEIDISQDMKNLHLEYLRKQPQERRFQVAKQILSPLLVQFPNDLDLHFANLQIQYDNLKSSIDKQGKNNECVSINDQWTPVLTQCKQVLAMVNIDDMILQLAKIDSKENEALKKVKKEKEKIKKTLCDIYKILLDILSSRLRSLPDFPNLSNEAVNSAFKEFEQTLTQVGTVFDLTTKDNIKIFGSFNTLLHIVKQQHGLVLKSIASEISGYSVTANKTELIAAIDEKINIYEKLGWKVLADYEKNAKTVRFPLNYTLF